MKIVIDTETSGLPVAKTFGTFYHPSSSMYYDTARLVQLAYLLVDEKNQIVKEVSHYIKPKGFIITL